MGKLFSDIHSVMENDATVDEHIMDVINIKEDADEELNIRLLGQYSTFAEDMEDDGVDPDLGEDTDDDIDDILNATADEDDGCSMGSDDNPEIVSDAIPEREYDDMVDDDFFDDADDDDM